MDKKNISYALLPFVFISILLFISYFGNQWYAETFGNPGVDYSYILYSINIKVPFLEWTIYPYVLAYPFWISTFFYVAYHSKKAFFTSVSILSILFIICGIWYFFFQSDVESWRLTSGLFLNHNYSTPRSDLNFSEKLVLLIYDAAGPRNALPSLHTIISWACLISLRMIKDTPIIPKIIIWSMSLSIIIATQTLKQHYIIDLIVGIALTEVTYWILKDSKLVKWLETFFLRINQQTKLNLEE